MSAQRTRWRRPLAAAAILTATGAAVLAAVAPANAESTAVPLSTATADWGVKESFRKYVEGPIGHGQITVNDGIRYDNGNIGWTGAAGTYDPTTQNVDVTFGTKVTFQAHKSGESWTLELSIAQLHVVTNQAAKTGTLVADVSSKDMDSGVVTAYDDLLLANLDLSAVTPTPGKLGKIVLANIPMKLTEVGVPAFGGFYPAGSALDPMNLTLKPKAADPGTSDTSSQPTDPEPSDTNSSSPPTTVDPNKPAAVKDGTLDWGVKESFRNYITGPIAKGKVDASGGATANGNGYRFVKATGEYDPTKKTLNASFQGAVRFYGHEKDGKYELDLTFTELRIEITGDKGVLYTGKTPLANLTVGSGLSVKDKVITLSALPATLTGEGATFFGNFYKAGDALDPLTAAIALDPNATLPGLPGDTKPGGGGAGGPSVSLPLTGASLTGIGIAGGALVLAGAGALWFAARRRKLAA